MASPRLTILCPLEHEARFLRRAGVRDVIVTGSGPDAVRRAMADLPPSNALILFGLAGGLVTGLDAAPAIAAVVDVHGHTWFVTLCAPTDTSVMCVGVDEAVLDPAAKSALARTTGAQLVDTESHAFAEAASRSGRLWTVVRGISDGPTDCLQLNVATWVTADGRTRAGRVLCDVMRHPSLLPMTWRLARRTRRGLQAALVRLRDLLDHGGEP
ncbi:MAG: hypothetical protein KAS72_06180 [Phycisphaerales bacterium]|nr:hypothetical protein [Phycisphaerales bacterium]